MDGGREVNWLDLPTHLMDSISEKLMIHINDFIRFGAVCHPWFSIYTQNRHHVPRQHPGLLVFTEPTQQDHQQRRSHGFYDLIEKRVYKFPLQLPPHNDFRGSNQGWLIYEKKSQLFLLNPFLPADNEIHLPPLTIFILNMYDSIEYYNKYGNGQSFIDKVILCGNLASSSSYVVVATDTYSSSVAFYKSGNKEWTKIIEQFEYIQDFVYYKDQVYILDGNKGLFACDVSSHPKVSKIVPPIDDVYAYELVESSGELLAVSKSDGSFKGYKLDQHLFDWVEIKSLSGWSLFISLHFCLSRLCSNYPGWKSNSIYMTIPQAPVVSVYKLEDGSTESLYLTDTNRNVHSTAIWIEPTLLGCSE